MEASIYRMILDNNMLWSLMMQMVIRNVLIKNTPGKKGREKKEKPTLKKNTHNYVINGYRFPVHVQKLSNGKSREA